MLCFPAKKTYKTCCCCFPLGFGTIVLGVLIGCAGVLNAVRAVQSDDWPRWPQYIPLIFGIFEGIAGVCAILASIARWKFGLSLLLKAYNMIVMLIIVTLITSWVVWATTKDNAIVDTAHPTLGDNAKILKNLGLPLMIVLTVFTVIDLVVMWWLESIVASHLQVLKVGGNGWERKTYVEIREDQATVKRSSGDGAAAV